MNQTEKPWLGVIADDVTGATDVAGHVVREGVATVQFFGVPPESAEVPAGVQCVVIALKSRSVAPDEAVADSLAAYEWLRLRGVAHFYFKYCSTFDSTARGNIGTVLDALALVTETPLVVVAPSAPENGRTVYQGKLFVGHKLLEESSLKDHPLNPMHDSDLRRILQPQSARTAGLVDWSTVVAGSDHIRRRFAELADSGAGFAVADALTNSDLDAIAAAIRADGHVLSSGSAGLVAALGRDSESARVSEPVTLPKGPAIVLSGSCSSATRTQVERYRAGRPSLLIDPITLARDSDALGNALAFVAEHRYEAPLIYSTIDEREVHRAQSVLGVSGAAETVERAFGEIARAARTCGIRTFIVAGGETSGAVTKALGVSAVRIGTEVATGVPWCVTIGDDRSALLLKSGNFGEPDFFAHALAMVDP